MKISNAKKAGAKRLGGFKTLTSLLALGVAQVLFGESVWAECFDKKPTVNTYDFGDAYIPQDAPLGSAVGPGIVDTWLSLGCPTQPLTVEAVMLLPKAPTMAAVAAGNSIKGAIYETNIPGLGVAVRTVAKPAFLCLATSSESFPWVYTDCNSGGYTYNFHNNAYLVKTGPIAPGRHDLNNLQIYRIDLNDTGTPLEWVKGFINGSVTVAGCSLPQATGNIIEVPMRSWEKRVFNGKGTFTDTQPFGITLNSCLAGTYANNPSWNYFKGNNANIRLDGAKGSTIINADGGILGLNSSSTAKGVAVQVLKQDGTPLPLGVDVPVAQVQDGVTNLQFGARYIQTSTAATGPQPGAANATANFTITYK